MGLALKTYGEAMKTTKERTHRSGWVVKMWGGAGSGLFLDEEGLFDTYDVSRVAWCGNYFVCGVRTRRFTSWMVAALNSYLFFFGRPVRAVLLDELSCGKSHR